MGTQKGRLFELARMYHTYQNQSVRKKKVKSRRDKPVEVKGEHFDQEKSISLSYNLDMYPEILYDSHQRQAPASQMSVFESDKSEAFYVEPFDAEDTVDVPYRETAEGDEDAKLEKIARGFGSESEMENMEEDVDKMKDMEEKLDSVFKSDDDESTAMQANEADPDNKDKLDNNAAPVSDAGAITGKAKDEASTYNATDEEFARDIGAILQGQKVYNAEHKKAVEKSGRSLSKAASNFQAKSAADPADMLDPVKNEHRIFEKIAQSMTFANSYDLGSIALNEKFELMDQEIEKEEVSRITKEDRNKSVSDADERGEQLSPAIDVPTTDSFSMGVEKYNLQTPLDQNNGGRLIKESMLQKGDLILASSSGAFDIIDGSLGSESIAGLYAGGNKLLTKGDGGALEEKVLQAHMGNKGVMVALRHQNMTAEKGDAIVDALTRLRIGPDKSQPESWLKINCPAVSLHPDVCDSDEVTDKKKCNAYTGKIYLGTLSNDSFMCAESIINAFEKSQIGFASLLSKEHNGSLKYVGHLKNKA